MTNIKKEWRLFKLGWFLMASALKNIVWVLLYIMGKFLSKSKTWLKNNIKAHDIRMFIIGGVVCSCLIICCEKITNNIKNSIMVAQLERSKMDAYRIELENNFNIARHELAEEINRYISEAAPDATVNPYNIIDLSSEYGVDVRLVLAQGHVESHFATKGTAKKTNSIFNVGAFDGHSAATQIKNGYGYTHPDYSVEPYLKLLKSRYLVKGKTERDLLNNFVDVNGGRYASNLSYEQALKLYWNSMDSISEKYKEYKEHRLRLDTLKKEASGLFYFANFFQ